MRKKLSLAEFTFMLALMTKPLYIWKSGSIQISDMLFILTTILIIYRKKGKIAYDYKSGIFLRTHFLIIIYQFSINILGPILWNPLGQYTPLLKVNLYYVFNFLVVYCVFSLIRINGYSRTVTVYITGTALSIALSLFGVFSGATRGRISGFFNNPNQLGYFCIIVMTAIIIYKKRLPMLIRIVCIIVCTYMSILSLSKAALVAMAVIFFLYFNEYESRFELKKIVVSLFGIGLAFLAVYILLFSDILPPSQFRYVYTMRDRMTNMMLEEDSSLGAGRGYSRIFEIGGFLLCGVGEGLYDRFASLSGFEIHSTYASILVSYGIIGAVMYISLFKKALFSRKYGLRYVIIFAGIALYSITHNGIRSTLLWGLLAMSYYHIRQTMAQS